MQIPPEQLDFVAAQTFGRDEAMFQSLLSFMTSVSLTLWAMVLVTAIVRYLFCHLRYRHGQSHSLRGKRVHQDGI
jgi:hypothetical protein